jgi:hypothetical protein
VFPVEIGLRDPRSQKRDLGHPSISPFNIAEGTSLSLRSRGICSSADPYWKRGISPATTLSSRPPGEPWGRNNAKWRDLRFLFSTKLQGRLVTLPAPVFRVLFLLKPQFKQRDVCLIRIAERERRNQAALRHQVFTRGATIGKSE